MEDIPEGHPCVSGGFENWGYEGCDQSVPLVLCRRERKGIQGSIIHTARGSLAAEGIEAQTLALMILVVIFSVRNFLPPFAASICGCLINGTNEIFQGVGFNLFFFFEMRTFVSSYH